MNGVPPPTVSIAVNPTSITVGQSATLTWSSTNATSCAASGAWTGSRATSGTLQVAPAAASNDTYTLICDAPGANTTATAAATLDVQAAPVAATPPAHSGGGALGLNTVLGLLLLTAMRVGRQQLQGRRAPSVAVSAARQLRSGRDSLRSRRQTG